MGRGRDGTRRGITRRVISDFATLIIAATSSTAAPEAGGMRRGIAPGSITETIAPVATGINDGYAPGGPAGNPRRPASFPMSASQNMGSGMQRHRAAVRQLVCSSAVVIAQAATPVGAAAATFEDSFARGETQLDWVTHPMLKGGAVEGRPAEEAPDRDGGIGVLRHEGGGLATVSYAKTAKAEDSFEVAAWVYCPREAEGRDGTLTGLTFYVHTGKGSADPEEGGFYRLVCDYRFGTGSFSLAYVGANIGRQPLELERWPLIEQTAPAGDNGWRRLRIEVEAGLIELYLDDVKLNERPIPAERVITDIANVDAGYAGVYAGHIGEGGTAEARIDDFIYVVR